MVDLVPELDAETAQDEAEATTAGAPVDTEASMAAIEAAAEAAAMETAEPEAEAEGEVPEEPATEASIEAEAADTPALAAQDDEIDPRLAMLGLTPDFAAAEVEAVEMAAAEIDNVPEIGSDALAARLSGLVPGETDGAAEAAVTTQVIVTGLVSVASIASFKRHMGRLPGVSHVGVSSGPDAEKSDTCVHSSQPSSSSETRTAVGRSPGTTAPTPTGVPVKIRSPGSSSTSSCGREARTTGFASTTIRPAARDPGAGQHGGDHDPREGDDRARRRPGAGDIR